MASVTLSKEHGYVLAVATSVPFILQWMAFKVGGARKAAGIAYPTMYASEAEVKDKKEALIFNCTQRGHQNTLENLPSFLILLTVSSIFYPLYAAGLGAVYMAGRVQYMRGYSTGDPKNRMRGGFQYLGLIGLTGLSIATVAKFFL